MGGGGSLRHRRRWLGESLWQLGVPTRPLIRLFFRASHRERGAINVTFTPSTTGSVTGTLSITHDDAGSPHEVSLSGAGISGKCIPPGGGCFGPGPNDCCPAPRPHHSLCSNPTGWGTCVED